MRGSRQRRESHAAGRGIIPAHAGLTKTLFASKDGQRDHPRACGAHVDAIIDAWRVWGSSPRMRGSPPHPHHHLARPRIIPAHAGLTGGRFVASSTVWDHPRACGAHCVLESFAAAHLGSSPRMRGSPSCVKQQNHDLGIIPAHAGLTMMIARFLINNGDHPRACGAHYDDCKIPYQQWGSSPRMRGSREHRGASRQHRGIIPAHAGLTSRGF